MIPSRTSVLLLAATCLALLGCGADEEAPAPPPAAAETRADRVDLADAVDDICALYEAGEGPAARDALGDAMRAAEGRSRADVERVVFAECGEAVTATSEQAAAERETVQAERQEHDRNTLAERAQRLCEPDEESGVVCVEGMAITFEDGTCDLGEDPFFWFGSVVNFNDEPVDVTIIMEVLDDAGVRVGEGSAVVRHLEPGRESTFRTMGNHRVTDQGTCELADVRVYEP